MAVFELNAIPIKFDCRKGQCKSCLVKVMLEGESGETLACMEDALEVMEIDTRGFQPETAIPAVPPMETKRVTTRKMTKKPLSEVNRANGKVFKILCQAQEAALDGEWEGCSDYAAELIEIANHFDQPDERQAVFLTGPCRDLLRDFTAVLRTSGQVRCAQLGHTLKTTIDPESSFTCCVYYPDLWLSIKQIQSRVSGSQATLASALSWFTRVRSLMQRQVQFCRLSCCPRHLFKSQ